MKTTKSTMVNEIIIHAGMHKTASTSIQNCLSDSKNQKLLAAKKYLYPLKWPRNHSASISSLFRIHPEQFHVHRRANRSKSQISKLNETYIHDIQEEVSQNLPNTLIISGEGISILELGDLVRFKNFLDSTFHPTTIRVLLYVRNPVSLKISKVQQVIGGSSRTLETASRVNFDRKNDSMSQQIKDLITIFSHKSVEVYSFEQAIRHNLGPVGHFLSNIGYDNEESVKFHMEKSNESLSQLAANIISFINEKHPFFNNGVVNSERYENDVLPIKRIKGPKFDFSWDKKQELQNIFNDEINWLKEHYEIDYSAKIEKEAEETHHRITNKQLLAIKKAYIEEPNVIQELMIEYLKSLSDSDVENSYAELQVFITDLQKPLKQKEKLKQFYASTKQRIKQKIKYMLFVKLP